MDNPLNVDENENTKEIEEVKQFLNGMTPPENLRLTVIARLKQEGLIKNNITMNTERFLWMAAIAASFLIGFFVETSISQFAPDQPANSQNQYLLLLHEDSSFNALESDIPNLIKEYTQWANDIGQRGDLIAAEKLTNESTSLGNMRPTSSQVSGYFVITAATVTEAIKLANTHPHLKYNGGIEVRPIERLR